MTSEMQALLSVDFNSKERAIFNEISKKHCCAHRRGCMLTIYQPLRLRSIWNDWITCSGTFVYDAGTLELCRHLRDDKKSAIRRFSWQYEYLLLKNKSPRGAPQMLLSININAYIYSVISCLSMSMLLTRNSRIGTNLIPVLLQVNVNLTKPILRISGFNEGTRLPCSCSLVYAFSILWSFSYNGNNLRVLVTLL